MRYLKLKEAADYLDVSKETIKRYVAAGKLPVYKLERAVRFRRDDLDELLSRNLEVLLTTGLRAVVAHSSPVKVGAGVWRITIQFHNTKGGNRVVVSFGPQQKFTEYFVEVTEEYLEDYARLPSSIKGAERFAMQYIKNRFEETMDKEGNREITRITEDKVACFGGKCRRGVQMPLSKE
jgi:excisionase family DNA binding protein